MCKVSSGIGRKSGLVFVRKLCATVSRGYQIDTTKRKVDLYMDTPGPLSICLTNMVIVFAVLIFLAFVIQLIHIVDPTKNKKK